MAIKFHPERAIYDVRTNAIRVPAIDGNKLVICAIEHDALCAALQYEDVPPRDLLDVYRRFGLAFHIIANYKYRIGRTEPDGVVLVTAEDIAALESISDEMDQETVH